MYIIVVGCGRIGLHLSKALMTVGNEVTVIEKDPQRSNNVIEDLGNVIVKGDGSALNILREAGAGRADLVVAVTGEDSDNLAVCQMAKEVFKTPRTVSLVKNPSHDALFKLLGVDRVINSTHLILSNIEDEVPNRVLVHVMDLGRHKMDIVTLSIPSDAAVVGKSLGEVELPPNSFVILVVSSEGPMLPSDDLVFQSGDDVLAVTSPSEEQSLHEILTSVEQ